MAHFASIGRHTGAFLCGLDTIRRGSSPWQLDVCGRCLLKPIHQSIIIGALGICVADKSLQLHLHASQPERPEEEIEQTRKHTEKSFIYQLFFVVVYFSILGMNLFGCKFCDKDSDGNDIFCDRKNFDSLLWATVTVFQVSSV